MELLTNICFYVAIAAAVVTLLLTLMSMLSVSNLKKSQGKDLEQARTGFFIFSALMVSNGAVAFLMTLTPGAITFAYPKTLAVALSVECFFLGYVIKTMARAIVDELNGD